MGDYGKTRAAAAAVTQKHGQALAGLEDEQMTEAPKRIWAQDAEPSECNFIGGGWWDDSIGHTQHPDIAEYHRADLSADLVRAALYETRGYTWSGVEALIADPEKIAAIVAQVMETEHE